MTTQLVVPLGAVGAGDVALAGGKGANLGELVRAGFGVPAGFVVTTHLYAEALRSAGLDPAAPATAPEVPAGLAAAVVDAYVRLGAGPVAVRSSATAEDLPGAAFAGQQETTLDVVGPDAVLVAVRGCWASLWSDRAVAYRRQVGFTDVPRTAVVVQRMVPSEHAGVLFTADPVTGARDRVLIESGAGLGEALVSGLVTPEHVVVDRRGRVTRRRSDAGSPGLPTETFRGLAATGRRIAAHFGRPQDVEWAFADETMWIVQARPLTALPPAPIRVGRVRRASGAICAELLPTRPYPLDLTAWTAPGWFAIATRMAAEIPGLRIDLAQVLPRVDGVLTELRPPHPRPTWRVVTAPVRLASRLRRFDPARWTEDPRFVAYEHAVHALRAQDPGTSSWADLLAVPAQVLALLDRYVDLRIDHLSVAAVHVVRLRLLLVALGLPGEFWPLLAGLPTRTRAANEALAAVAAQIRADEAWREAFREASDTALVAAVWHDDAHGPLREALQAWLDAYGHRETTSAALVSSPTWADDPTLLLGNLRALVGGPVGSGPAVDADVDSAVDPDVRAADALAALRRRRRVRLTRSAALLTRATAAARAAMTFREDSHVHALRLRPVLRRVLLEAGDRLVRAGVLATRDDVFALQLDELRGLGDPRRLDGVETQRVQELVRRRAARRAELGTRVISPATLHPGARRASADALVSGAPGGGGRARGVVCVVRGPAEFGRLRPGEVLVCPYTNPAWTPLFPLAAAVVADVGSFGSHAAIVAREYGIPAVMGTGDGTRVLTDGQAVLVDGDRGDVVPDPGAPRG